MASLTTTSTYSSLFCRIDLPGWLCCGDCGGDGDGGWGVDLGRGMWGWGQTKSLDSGLQNSRILSNKYHCLCSDRPDGVITSGSLAAEKESVVNLYSDSTESQNSLTTTVPCDVERNSKMVLPSYLGYLFQMGCKESNPIVHVNHWFSWLVPN